MLEGVQGFIDNLPQVFTLYNITIILLGSLGGLILGALPGVSPTMSVALLVPFTFYMDPASGLILLGAVYASSVAGGAISAVLINIPGAPANIATVLDGYPMAKAGKAQLALYTCFISSFIGGVIGMIVMILLTLPLAEVALQFGSTELFWISILGLTRKYGQISHRRRIRGMAKHDRSEPYDGGVPVYLQRCAGRRDQYNPGFDRPVRCPAGFRTGGELRQAAFRDRVQT